MIIQPFRALIIAGFFASTLMTTVSAPNLVGWGKIWNGNQTVAVSIPEEAADLIAVAGGMAHTAGLRRDGIVITWGANFDGQLEIPEGLSGVVQIAAGDRHTLALRSDGTVVAWGANDLGQLDNVQELDNVVRIAAGANHSLALLADGTVVAWGDNECDQTAVPEGLVDVVDIAASADHSLALLSNGAVRMWNIVPGRIDPRTNDLPKIADGVAIAAGRDHMLVLRADGTVRAWGEDFAGQTKVPDNLTSVRNIAASGDHSFALKEDGTIVAWGHNGAGQTDIPNNLPDIASIRPASDRSLALLSDGPPVITGPFTHRSVSRGDTVYLRANVVGAAPLRFQWERDGLPIDGATSSWLPLRSITPADSGDYRVTVTNAHGSSMSAPISLAVSVGTQPNVIAWSQESPVLIEGGPLESVTAVPEAITDAVAISVSPWFNLVLRANGAIVAWGGNDYGETDVPNDLQDAVMISAGRNHALALQSDGEVRAWGRNDSGESDVPNGLTNVLAIAAGSEHSLALVEGGRVVAWGNNELGQTDVPTDLTDIVAISAGSTHSVALSATGPVTVWGGSRFQEIEIPDDLTDVVAIQPTFALKRNGTVVTWGQTPAVPEHLNDIVALGQRPILIRADGTPVSWGQNQFFGNGEVEEYVPAGIRNAASVGLGFIHGLALVQPDGPIRPDPVSEVTWQSDQFAIVVQTERGKAYQLEYSDALSEGDWLAMHLILGNGSLKTVFGPTDSRRDRYYRLRRW